MRTGHTVLEDAGIPNDAGVVIEFNIPQTGKPVDFIVTGTREDHQRTAVIVELKQWQEAKATTKDAIVSTFVGGREREMNHPSYQACQTQGAGALLPEFEAPEIQKTPPAYPFPILSPEEAADCPNAVPIFDIKIAAGDFSKEQWLCVSSAEVLKGMDRIKAAA